MKIIKSVFSAHYNINVIKVTGGEVDSDFGQSQKARNSPRGLMCLCLHERTVGKEENLASGGRKRREGREGKEVREGREGMMGREARHVGKGSWVADYIYILLPSEIYPLSTCPFYLFKEKVRNLSSIGMAREVKLNFHEFTLK